MTTAGPSSRHSHSPHPYRHHPYAKPSAPAAPAMQQRSSAAQPNGNANGDSGLPPSPPRSRRDPSETPSIGLGVAFGGSAGGKWWDEELPAPPASLTAILDSFRKSGEGDRELLLSILGAKKAEEERLTALIQTRLTILQARLSLHSAAAAVGAAPPIAFPSSSPLMHPQAPTIPAEHIEVHPAHSARSPSLPRDSHASPDPANGYPGERTPSLSSSRSTGGSASSGLASPPLPSLSSISSSYSRSAGGFMHPPPMYGDGQNQKINVAERDQQQPRDKLSYWQLPIPLSSQAQQQPRTTTTRMDGPSLPPILKPEDRRALYGHSNDRERSMGSVSPTEPQPQQRRDRSGSGLEMLLDAGMRVDSGEC